MSHIDEASVLSESSAFGMKPGEGETEAFVTLGNELLDVMDSIETFFEPAQEVAAQPLLEKGPDPLNAIVRRVHVVESDPASHSLDGVRVAVKDCIAVAGVEMSAGSSVLGGFVPHTHSEVVSRLLGAGASIEAITNMDCLAMSAAGDSSHFGPVLCPQDPSRLAGGSSSGSAASLHYEGIDVAIGTDTGGSVRVPSSWCGVLGIKPTHGLVSYRGVVAIDQRFDHVGAMATNALDLARTLDVMAGPDDLDPRQRQPVPDLRFVETLDTSRPSLAEMRFGLVEDALSEDSGVEAPVRAAMLSAVEALKECGAVVEFVSLPEHATAGPIVFNMIPEGFRALVDAGGNGYQWEGEYWPELAEAMQRGVAEGADHLSPQVKLALILGRVAQRAHRGGRYADGAELARRLTAAYDRSLAGFDALLMPTVPALPYVNDPSLPLEERIMRSWATLGNTSSANITGHPAISMPVAVDGKLPVGVMAVGRKFADADLVGLAGVVEAELGWNQIAATR